MQKITKGFFITGTDTSVGKTVFATSLLKALSTNGYKTVALKPIACGRGGYNSDALMLLKYATHKMPYQDINPFIFYEPIAPHIAAKNAGIVLSVKTILQKTKFALESKVDYIIIEGAGGLYVPLNDKETMADLIKNFNYPAILVVGLRVGCLNHALLTFKAIVSLKIPLAGWVANIIDSNMLYVEQNIQFISKHIKAPLLAIIPYQKKINIERMAELIAIDKFIRTAEKPRQQRKF